MASINNTELSWEDWNAEEADFTQLFMPTPPQQVGREKELFPAQILHLQINMDKKIELMACWRGVNKVLQCRVTHWI